MQYSGLDSISNIHLPCTACHCGRGPALPMKVSMDLSVRKQHPTFAWLTQHGCWGPPSQVREKVAAGAVTLDKFVVVKQLTKRPEDYPDAKNQPHVQVALRRRAAHKRDGTMQVRRDPKPASLAILGSGMQVAPPGRAAHKRDGTMHW